jgi:hypothetical protein
MYSISSQYFPVVVVVVPGALGVVCWLLCDVPEDDGVPWVDEWGLGVPLDISDPVVETELDG